MLIIRAEGRYLSSRYVVSGDGRLTAMSGLFLDQ